MTLQEKRAKIAEDHKAQAKYDPHWQAEAKAGRCITKRPVAFKCDDEIVVIGDDVAVIVAAVKKFKAKADADPSYAERAKSDGQMAYTISRVDKFLATPAGPEIRVGTQVWNALLHAMREANTDDAGKCTFDVVLAEGLVE